MLLSAFSWKSAQAEAGPSALRLQAPEMAAQASPDAFLSWTRPQDPVAPSVWGQHQFEDVRYVVQDATPELVDRMMRLYVEEYMQDEPASACVGLGRDEVSTAEFSFLMTKALAQGVSLVALELPDDSSGPEPEVVGGMILPVLSAEDPPLPEMSGSASLALLALNVALRTSAPHCHPLTRPENPVTEYMCDLGLYVRRDRRRRGLGDAILACVAPLCRALGVPHFSTLFTGATSQAMAARAGLKELARIKYHDVLDQDGRAPFHSIQEEDCVLFGVDTDKD